MLTPEQAKELIGDTPIISDEDTAEFAIRLIQLISATESQNALVHDLTMVKQEAAKCRQSYEFGRALEVAKTEMCSDPDFIKRNIRIETGFTHDDFVSGDEPYKRIYMSGNSFERKQEFLRVQQMAKDVGISKNEFADAYRRYEQSLRYADDNWNRTNELPDVKGNNIDLYLAGWTCNVQDGVKRLTDRGEEIACIHPVVPVKRLVNIDTDEEKLEVAFLKGRSWKTFTAPKSELFDASKLVRYSARGLSVTSRSAKVLSEYLCEIEGVNYNKITEIKSVSRLGFIGEDKKDFSPYVKDSGEPIVFDGETNYAAIYSTIANHNGMFEDWRETALRCRTESLTAQIMLAASFASVIINKIGGLCFFVHLWGVESGTGKSVALMLAASVWGNPEIGGGYVQTFNATQVGHERTAAFLNNVPMCIDELQLSKDSHGRSKFDVYQLAQGVGRTRGTKAGGIDNIPRWSLCILTTGESPIVKDNAGAGAVNRVIDIECRANDAVIKDGQRVSRELKSNYGHAGEMFVNSLTEDVIEEIKRDYDKIFAELCKGETTEKQAMAAAMILVGDKYADKFIFKSGKSLTVQQISEFLKSKASVSAGQRGYDFMCDWVAAHYNNFLIRDDDGTYNIVTGETYGEIKDDTVLINSSIFRRTALDAGYDDKALLSWLNTNGLLEIGKKGFTKRVRIGKGTPTQCVVMRINDETEEEYEGFEDLI